MHAHVGQGTRDLEDGKDDGLLRIVSELEHLIEILGWDLLLPIGCVSMR